MSYEIRIVGPLESHARVKAAFAAAMKELDDKHADAVFVSRDHTIDPPAGTRPVLDAFGQDTGETEPDYWPQVTGHDARIISGHSLDDL